MPQSLRRTMQVTFRRSLKVEVLMVGDIGPSVPASHTVFAASRYLGGCWLTSGKSGP